MAHEEFVEKAGQWSRPEELARLVERERTDITHEDFFNKPEHQPVKDAWQAATFALGLADRWGKSLKVRLSSQDGFPDFQIEAEGKVFGFESVMAVNRPLGKVYRGDRRTGPIPTEIPKELPTFDTTTIERVVAKKAAKKYQGKVHLLGYVNTAGAGAEFEEVAKSIRAAAGDSFESVWLLGLGREVGTSGAPANFIGCAKDSPDLVACPGWWKVPKVGRQSAVPEKS